jgi:hypothetical protein
VLYNYNECREPETNMVKWGLGVLRSDKDIEKETRKTTAVLPSHPVVDPFLLMKRRRDARV